MILIYRQCRKKQQCLWGSSSFLISTLLPPTKQTRFERRWNISTWGWHCLTKAHLINTPHISHTRMWWMLKNPLQLCRRGRITAIVLEIWQSPSCSSACFLSSCAANSFSVLKPSSGFLHPVTGSEFGFLAELISVTFPPAQKWLSSISWLFWGHPTPVSQGITPRAGALCLHPGLRTVSVHLPHLGSTAQLQHLGILLFPHSE